MTVDPIGFAAFIVGIGVAVILLWRDREQLRTELAAHRKDSDEKLAQMQQKLQNAYDKIETMFGELADMQGLLNYERGIFDKEYAEARRKKRIEDLEESSEPDPEPEPKPKKRGHHAG